MNIYLIIVLVGVAGIAVGAFGHAFFAKEAAATEEELRSYSQRLRSAFDADVTTARARVAALVAEIDKKIL
jgi:hypothetical protein